MKFYTILPKELKPYYNEEIRKYRSYLSKGELDRAWHHLERAHILGQRYPFAHNYVHWRMLLFGIKIKSIKEVLGQILRLVFGGLFSFLGTVPIGNPGGANVPSIKPFPIPQDLQDIFIKVGIK